MLSYEIIVSGRVQGVGFRNYAAMLAKDHHIKGTVRNLSNGDVMIIAQADDNNIVSYTNALKVPQHRFMKISQLTVKKIDLDKSYNTFSAVY